MQEKQTTTGAFPGAILGAGALTRQGISGAAARLGKVDLLKSAVATKVPRLGGFTAAPFDLSSAEKQQLLVKFIGVLRQVDEKRYGVEGVKGGWNVLRAGEDLIPQDDHSTTQFIQELVRPITVFLFQGNTYRVNGEMSTNPHGPLNIQLLYQFLQDVQLATQDGPLYRAFGGLIEAAVRPDTRERQNLSRARFFTTFIFDTINDYVHRRAEAAYPSPDDAPIREVAGQIQQAVGQGQFELARDLSTRAIELQGQPPEMGDPVVRVDEVVEEIQTTIMLLAACIRDFTAAGFQLALLS